MSLYGDLDISVIDELLSGKTHSNRASFWLKPTESLEIYRDQIAIGRQIYIVYPLIQESAKMDFKDLMDGHEYFSWFPAAAVFYFNTTRKDETRW
jgi:ATP-dependent DNA helicase RecG